MFISFEKVPDEGRVVVNTDHIANAIVERIPDGSYAVRFSFGGEKNAEPVMVYFGPADMTPNELSARERALEMRVLGNNDKSTWTKKDDANYRTVPSSLRP